MEKENKLNIQKKRMLRQEVVEYIEKNSNGKPILLPLESELLKEVLFEEGHFCSEIMPVIEKIDFSNVSFDGFSATQKNFTGLTGVRINPQTLINKDLSYAICEGVEFIGSFKDVVVAFTNFKNSLGAKFNPKEVAASWLVGTICADVEFTGNFKGVKIQYTSFKDSIGAKINLDEISQEFLYCTDFCDAELRGVIKKELVDKSTSFVGSNYEEVINFKKLSVAEKRKLSMEELCKYYRLERKHLVVTDGEVEGIEFRKKIHPGITIAMATRRLQNHQTLTVYKNGQKSPESIRTCLEKIIGRHTIPKEEIVPSDTERPVIFAITHIGKYDIEMANEAIKSAYYLLSDDEEYMHRTVDGFFTYLNGVVYVDNDYPEDAYIAKETNKKILNKNGYIMWFPERIWNLSPNKMILDCKTGLVEAAHETEALILPIAIDQRDKEFHINIGDFVDPRSFETTNGEFAKQNKINEINNLRNKMATLKFQLWENNPEKFDDVIAEYLEIYPDAPRESIIEDYYEKFVEERIAEWPFITKEDIDKMIFKPKGIVTEEEVFEPIRRIKKDTSFAQKVKRKVLENSPKK